MTRRCVPTSFNTPDGSVEGVVGVGSVKEMLGVTARRIIASVATHIWPVSMSQEEGHAIGSLDLTVSPDGSVSPSVDIGLPRPAFIWRTNSNLVPESILDRDLPGGPGARKGAVPPRGAVSSIRGFGWSGVEGVTALLATKFDTWSDWSTQFVAPFICCDQCTTGRRA
jgi:hypothetical protein